MALFVESHVRARAHQEVVRKGRTAGRIIAESAKTFDSVKPYDVFLSHSIKDTELILGIKGLIEDLGYSVYIDWIDDPDLERTKVSKETAKKLRYRMNSSRSLFFVTTDNADNSKWMPWECGYFDGVKEKVAIVPVKETSYTNEYNGQEYLGLYPYVVKQKSEKEKDMLWIHQNSTKYISYDYWVKTPNNIIVWKG
jgi:hypothetical protein